MLLHHRRCRGICGILYEPSQRGSDGVHETSKSRVACLQGFPREMPRHILRKRFSAQAFGDNGRELVGIDPSMG